ncbi:MAG: O-antigen ligase family protein [Nitrospirae bacterium]|nr:O-antigen ligase family protein [Nitrospirota bacterium]
MPKHIAAKHYVIYSVVFLYLVCSAALCALYPFYVVFAVNLLIVLSVLFLIKPTWGVYCLIFLVPISRETIYFAFTGTWNIHFIFRQSEFYLNALPVYTPVLLLTCAGFVLHRWASLSDVRLRPDIKTLFAAITVYAAITLYWTQNMLHGISQYYYLVSNIMLFTVIVYTAVTEDAHKKMLWCLLVSCLIEAVLSYWFRSLDTYIDYGFAGDIVYGMRIYGGLLASDGSPEQAHGLQDAHETSMLMNIFIGVAAALFLTVRSKGPRIFLGLCVITGLSVVIGTESRAGAAAFIFMAMCFLFINKKTSKHFMRYTIVLLAAALVFYIVEQKIFSVMAGKDTTIMRLLRIGGQIVDSGDVIDPGLSKSETAGPGRRTIWGYGFSGLGAKWPVGIGIGSYKYLYRTPHAHSVPFSFLFDLGLIGFVLFFLILYAITKHYIRLIKLQDTYMQLMSMCLMSTLAAVIFHGCFDYDYTYPLFWLFGGLLYSTLLLAAKSEEALT